MSSEDFVCAECGEIGTYCGTFYSCECGSAFCSHKCAKAAGLGELNDEGEESCSYCRGENFTEEDILEYALKKLKTNRSQIIEEMARKED